MNVLVKSLMENLQWLCLHIHLSLISSPAWPKQKTTGTLSYIACQWRLHLFSLAQNAVCIACYRCTCWTLTWKLLSVLPDPPPLLLTAIKKIMKSNRHSFGVNVTTVFGGMHWWGIVSTLRAIHRRVCPLLAYSSLLPHNCVLQTPLPADSPCPPQS